MKVLVSFHNEAQKEAHYVKKFLENHYDKLDVDLQSSRYKEMDYEDSFIKSIVKQDYIGQYHLIIVLLSPNAHKSRDLDWTIGSAIQHPKQGLLAIMTKSYGKNLIENEIATPRCLLENIKCGYCLLFFWNDLFNPKYYDLYFILEVLKAAADNPANTLPVESKKLLRTDKI